MDDELLQNLIDHTMDLSLAITWGLSRCTSPHHAESYMFYMKRYLASIKDLFPDYDLKPNHYYALQTFLHLGRCMRHGHSGLNS